MRINTVLDLNEIEKHHASRDARRCCLQVDRCMFMVASYLMRCIKENCAVLFFSCSFFPSVVLANWADARDVGISSSTETES